jgi:hypothetical protein
LLLRLTRSDRAARIAALQAEVVALRATVLALRSELDVAQAPAPAGPSPLQMRWVTLNLPLVRAALQPDEAAPEADAAVPAGAAPMIELDLRAHEARKELVLADLPEAALLDPRQDRDAEVSDPATDDDAGRTVEAPVRRIA